MCAEVQLKPFLTQTLPLNRSTAGTRVLVLHMPLSPLPTHPSLPCPMHSTEVGATRFETPSPSPDTVDPHTGNPTPEHTETELMPRSSLDPDPSPRSALSNLPQVNMMRKENNDPLRPAGSRPCLMNSFGESLVATFAPHLAR